MKRVLLALVIVCILTFPVLAQAPAVEVVNVVTLSRAADSDNLTIYPLAAWSPDGTLVALKDAEDKMLHLLDAASGDDLASLDVTGISALAFNRDGTLLAVAGGGLLVFVLDVQTLTDFGDVTEDTLLDALNSGVFRNLAMFNLDKSSVEVATLAFSGDSSFILAEVLFGDTYAWDIREAADFSALRESSDPSDIPFAASLEVPQDLYFWPRQVYPTDEGIFALTFDGGSEKTVFAFQSLTADFDSGQIAITDARAHVEVEGSTTATVLDARLSADTNTLLVASTDHLLLVQADGSTQSILYPDDKTAQDLNAVEVSVDGRVVAAYWRDKSLRFWDAASGEEVFAEELNIPPLRQGTLLYSPDNRKLLVAAANGIQIWELSGELVAEGETIVSQAETPVPTATCEVDLTGTIALLEQAQEAAASGDSAQAAQLMGEARTQLEDFELQCSSLPETYTVSLEFGQLTFDYPAGWLVRETPDFGVTLGSTEAALDIDMSSPEPPSMAEGDSAVIVNLVDAGFFGATDLADASPQELLTQIMRQTPDSIGEISAISNLSVNDHAAVIAQIVGEGYGIIFLLIDAGQQATNGDKVFVMVVGIGEPSALETLEPTLLAIADTVEVE